MNVIATVGTVQENIDVNVSINFPDGYNIAKLKMVTPPFFIYEPKVKRHNRFPDIVNPINDEDNVYIMHCSGTKYYKIGHSVHPVDRLKQLQTGSPFILKIIGCTLGGKEFEDVLSEKYESNNVHLEWYRFNEVELNMVVSDFRKNRFHNVSPTIELPINNIRTYDIFPTPITKPRVENINILCNIQSPGERMVAIDPPNPIKSCMKETSIFDLSSEDDDWGEILMNKVEYKIRETIDLIRKSKSQKITYLSPIPKPLSVSLPKGIPKSLGIPFPKGNETAS